WTLDRGFERQASDGRYLTDVWTTEAIDFVRRHRNEPFYLHLAYNAPHWPLQAPEDRVAAYRRRGFNEAVSTIYAMVEVMDDGIGRLLATLDETGLRDTTFVLFTSDNGPDFTQTHGGSTERFNVNLRGSKTLVLEGGINVPAIVSWPGAGLGGGRSVDEPVHFCDWLPTTLSVAGIDAGRRPGLPLDGTDRLAAMHGHDDAPSPPRFWQWNRYEPVSRCNAAMRDGDWKLVFAPIDEAMSLDEDDATMDRELKYNPQRHAAILPMPTARTPVTSAHMDAELFDVSRDPQESKNVAADHPGRVREMTDALDAWFADVEGDCT
ncbi:sulfatase-like hydrolase/transferase, partial [Phytoactinopolyspora endophytica]|uniref:sulfatase-like hydrolase/transferase n=1 Tax=Phytoactinopolyspora endophytica TaxID=1642495 RepID=UPI0013ECCA40